MADQKITQLTSLTASQVSDSDVVAIVDVSPTATTKKMTRTEFFKNTPNIGIGTTSSDASFTVKGQTVIGALVAENANLANLLSGAPPQLIAGWSVPAITWTPASYTEVVFTRDGTMGIDILASNTDNSRINFSDTDAEDSGWIDYDHANDSMNFRVNASERMRINSSGNVGIGTTSPSERLSVTGNVTISGSLSKGSGSFRIDHPLKPDTHHLVHSFIEGPQADNIYRGKTALVDGAATVNLDEAARMTEGTFVALNGNIQCFTTNETGWTAVRGTVSGNILAIEAQDQACTDTVSWLVIGERHDQHMLDTAWTDEQGRIIVEPEKVIVEEEPENVIVEEVPE